MHDIELVSQKLKDIYLSGYMPNSELSNVLSEINFRISKHADIFSVADLKQIYEAAVKIVTDYYGTIVGPYGIPI